MSIDPAEVVYEFVRSVPRGRVVTYGQVAEMVEGISLTARQVGQIMNAAPEGVPWQRVVGAGGHLPIGKRSPFLKSEQQRLLEAEGVVFRKDHCVDMPLAQWPAVTASQSSLFDSE
jgi:methylated-DNA-protein-cysteine methyltransferase-like protein